MNPQLVSKIALQMLNKLACFTKLDLSSNLILNRRDLSAVNFRSKNVVSPSLSDT